MWVGGYFFNVKIFRWLSSIAEQGGMVVRQTLATRGYKRVGPSHRLGGTEREARRVCSATIPPCLLYSRKPFEARRRCRRELVSSRVS